MNEHIIGNEIEAYCGKCKTDTLHLITAISDNKIEKVLCKICTSYHKYKEPGKAENEKKTKAKAEKKSPAPKKRKTRRSKTLTLLQNANVDSASDYKMSKSYEVDTAINHKKFGLGIVKDVISDRKITVLFEDGERILVQNIQN